MKLNLLLAPLLFLKGLSFESSHPTSDIVMLMAVFTWPSASTEHRSFGLFPVMLKPKHHIHFASISFILVSYSMLRILGRESHVD